MGMQWDSKASIKKGERRKEQKGSRTFLFCKLLAVKGLPSLLSFILRVDFWSCSSVTDFEIEYLQQAKALKG